MDYILITGVATNQTINFLLKDVFQQSNIEINSFRFEHKISNNKTLLINCNHFEDTFILKAFKDRCNQIKSNITAIICLETLNPRPEYLNNSLELLESIFRTSELRDKLYLFLTDNQKSKQIQTIRSQFLKVEDFFNRLRVTNKESFASKRIWLLESKHLEELRTINFFRNGKKKWIGFLLFIALICLCFNLKFVNINELDIIIKTFFYGKEPKYIESIDHLCHLNVNIF